MSLYTWTDWGLIRAIGDYALTYNKGDIVEFGMGQSTVVISELANHHGRKSFHCDINPASGHLVKSTNAEIFICKTNAFFDEVKLPPIAFAFIDAWHEYKQVRQDFFNLFPFMVDNGYILLHDTYPPNKEFTGINWCFNAYLLRQELEKLDTVDCHTFVWDGRPSMSDKGCGLTMVRKKPSNLPEYQK